MASGSYMTPIYSRSQSEVQGDLHKGGRYATDPRSIEKGNIVEEKIYRRRDDRSPRQLKQIHQTNEFTRGYVIILRIGGIRHIATDSATVVARMVYRSIHHIQREPMWPQGL
ncbi:hypothetical protein TNCV_1250871 [Trichonephila clavipes]|nr:hypothetical protein TNCV_1250871 [Trichonephila clavipes]